jgi:hypothetical protein
LFTIPGQAAISAGVEPRFAGAGDAIAIAQDFEAFSANCRIPPGAPQFWPNPTAPSAALTNRCGAAAAGRVSPELKRDGFNVR